MAGAIYSGFRSLLETSPIPCPPLSCPAKSDSRRLPPRVNKRQSVRDKSDGALPGSKGRFERDRGNFEVRYLPFAVWFCLQQSPFMQLVECSDSPFSHKELATVCAITLRLSWCFWLIEVTLDDYRASSPSLLL